MLNRLRDLIELIRCGDPWDWEVEADDHAVVASGSARAEGGHEVGSRAPELPSSPGTVVREPVTSAA